MGYYSVSDAIADVLEEMYFLRQSLQLDLINYSALARLIHPMVVERTGTDVGLDAIIMAIRRHSKDLAEQKQATELYEVLRECKINLQSDMAEVHFKRSSEIYYKIIGLEKEINYGSGEKMYVIQRSDTVCVITMARFLPRLIDLTKGDPSQLLHKDENLALATINTPPETPNTIGVLGFFARQFETLGVSIHSVFSSYQKVSFLFDEAEAPAVYERLANAINESESLGKRLRLTTRVSETKPQAYPTNSHQASAQNSHPTGLPSIQAA